MKFLWIVLALIVGLFLCAVPAVIIFKFYSLFGHLGPSTDPKHWGEFGSFLGGVVGPFITALSVFFLGLGLIYQVRSQNKNNDHMDSQLAALIAQNTVAEVELRHKQLSDVMGCYSSRIGGMEIEKAEIESEITKLEKGVWLREGGLGGNIKPEDNPLRPVLEVHRKNLKDICERLRCAQEDLRRLQDEMISVYKNSAADVAG